MIYSCKKDLLKTEIDEDLVLLDRESGFYFGLNSVGHQIWQYLEKGISKNVMINKLINEYHIEKAQCLIEVEGFIHVLKTKGLIKDADK